MDKCNQCGKPAVQVYNGNPLCVDCLTKLAEVANKQEEARQRNIMLLMQEKQAVEEFMYRQMGLPAPTPKYDFSHLKQPDRYTFNNINVSDSVVGTINTAEVQSIDVAMSHISNGGNQGLATALKELTEGIIESQELNPDQKNELIENINFVATQARLPEDKRKKGLLKSVLIGIKENISFAISLGDLWTKVEPILRQIGL